jgi:hypothetical protein
MFPEASKVLGGGPYKFGANVRAASPCYLVDAALRGHIVGEDQDKIVDDLDSIDMKSNTLVGKIGDEAKARRDANPEFDGSQPAQTMTRGPTSFINIQRTHTVRLRVMALPMAQGRLRENTYRKPFAGDLTGSLGFISYFPEKCGSQHFRMRRPAYGAVCYVNCT